MDKVTGPSLYLRLAERQARMEGFAVNHFEDRYVEATDYMRNAATAGTVLMREHVVEGIENFPKALNMLFTGGHWGKLLVRP